MFCCDVIIVCVTCRQNWDCQIFEMSWTLNIQQFEFSNRNENWKMKKKNLKLAKEIFKVYLAFSLIFFLSSSFEVCWDKLWKIEAHKTPEAILSYKINYEDVLYPICYIRIINILMKAKHIIWTFVCFQNSSTNFGLFINEAQIIRSKTISLVVLSKFRFALLAAGYWATCNAETIPSDNVFLAGKQGV